MFNTILALLVAANVSNPIKIAHSIHFISKQEYVDPIVMTSLVIIESRGNPKAINIKTGDYGILQIHLDSHPQVGIVCAMTLDCNLRAGAKIIKKLNRICEYNLGKKTLTEKRMKKCLEYEAKYDSLSIGDK